MNLKNNSPFRLTDSQLSNDGEESKVDLDSSNTGVKGRSLGWGAECPDYLWDHVREYYEVEEHEKIAQLFVLAEEKREEFITKRDELKSLIDKYNVSQWQQRGHHNPNAKTTVGDAERLEQIQQTTYESLDLYNVLSNPLGTFIEYIYNEMENIYNKDLEEFEEEKRIKQQMMSVNRDIWCLQERSNYIEINSRVAFITTVSENELEKKQFCEGRVTSIQKQFGSGNHEHALYYVTDIGEKDESNSSKYSITEIIPLPTLEAVPQPKRKMFEPKDRVLALFPGTTCFYPATVLKKPNRSMRRYSLQFDDDEGKKKEVQIENVMPFFDTSEEMYA